MLGQPRTWARIRLRLVMLLLNLKTCLLTLVLNEVEMPPLIHSETLWYQTLLLALSWAPGITSPKILANVVLSSQAAQSLLSLVHATSAVALSSSRFSTCIACSIARLRWTSLRSLISVLDQLPSSKSESGCHQRGRRRSR